MENNESNPKPTETGGLKIMTVFIVVLAAHVIVIGGFTVYHLMSGGGTDADLVVDKNHKTVKVTADSVAMSENAAPDSANIDKPTTSAATTPPPDTTGTPITIPAPPVDTATTATIPASTVTPAPVTPVQVASQGPEPTANSPSGPIQAGKVITASKTKTAVATDSETAPAMDAEPNSTAGSTYAVKAHETLAHIAKHNHVKMAALRSANGLKTDKLHLGQKLIIPAKTETAVASDQTDSTTAPHASTGPDRTLLGDSPIFSKSVSSTTHDKAAVAGTSSNHHMYTVAKGDTLTRIAHKFHTTSSALMGLNNISDARKLHPGQKLRIPSAESRSATSAPSESRPDRIEPRATPSAQLANFIN